LTVCSRVLAWQLVNAQCDVNATSTVEVGIGGGEGGLGDGLHRGLLNVTPLAFACLERPDAVVPLLACRAEVNSGTACIGPPLVVACLRGRTDIVKLLLSREPKVNVSPRVTEASLEKYTGLGIGLTPLTAACRAGNTTIIDLLIEQSTIKLNKHDRAGWTPLTMAIHEAHWDAASMLLKAGADPTVSTARDSVTALHSACAHGSLAFARLLLELGAEINAIATVNMHLSSTQSKKLACSEQHPC
jgi:ankyrin repeat protein